MREYSDDWFHKEINNDEEEIKNCEIRINDEIIPFNYLYK